jgi:hypothetical protein
MSDLIMITLQHVTDGVMHMESWRMTKEQSSGLRDLLGPPDAYTRIPTSVIQDNPNAIRSGEWTKFAEGIE